MMYVFLLLLLIFSGAQSAFAGGAPKAIALEIRVEEYARPHNIIKHIQAGDTLTVRSESWMKRQFVMLCPQIYFPPDEVAPLREYILLDRKETQKFNPETIPGSTVEVNYHALNIIGHRMRQMRDAVLRLSVSPYRASCFGEADSLGALRMNRIRDYLADVWEITPERIIVPPPAKGKYLKNRDKFWRNGQRYVRLSSDTPELLFAVKSEDTTVLCYVRTMEFQPSKIILDSSAIDSIQVLFDRDGSVTGRKLYTKFPAKISYFGGETVCKELRPNGIQCKILLKNGDTLLSPRSPLNIPPTGIYEEVTHSCFDGSFLRREYLLYFGNNTAITLSLSQILELRTVLPGILFDSNTTTDIYISGYVEFGGKEYHNKRITERRARAVENVLRSLLPVNSAAKIVVYGNGSEYPLFDSSFPATRNLNNCVRIGVKAAQP